MVDFFVDNWQFLVSLLVSFLVSLIACLLKRKKIVVDKSVLDSVYQKAITFIEIAESKFKSGEDKKAFVIGLLKESFPNLSEMLNYKVEPFVNRSASDDVYSFVIESILSTPQKKDKEKK